MTDRQEIIARRLRLFAKARGLSGVNIEAATGISMSSWSQWTHNRRIPLDKAGRLLEVFGLSLDWIYYGRRDGVPAGILAEMDAIEAESDEPAAPEDDA